MLGRLCTKLDLALYLVQIKIANQNSIALSWELDFPRIIPSDSAIFEYARNGSVTDVYHLLNRGRGSAKDCSPTGITLLHVAARTRNLDLLRLLLREGANVNAPDEDGETPLHSAMGMEDNYEIVRVLIESGADLYGRAVDGKTPLHCIFNNTVGEVLQTAEHIEDTMPDSEDMSISHFLAWSSRSTSNLFRRARIHDIAGLWSVDIEGRTCLHLAASRGNLDVLSHLLENASSEEARRTDYQGCTPLHYAVLSSRAVDVIDLLVSHGSDVHAKDSSGCTAADWAVKWNNRRALRKLTPGDGTEMLDSKTKVQS